MASLGYPNEYKKNTKIKNLELAENENDIEIFHAGTELKDTELCAIGGRVLSITGTGNDLQTALNKIYTAIDKIDWPESTFRKDIGWRAINNG